MECQLVTVAYLKEQDRLNQFDALDTTAFGDCTLDELLLDTIIIVSDDLTERVGHDWGDSTSTVETLDGVKSRDIFLQGITQYPLRELASIDVNEVAVDLDDIEYRIYRNRQIGNLGWKIRRYKSTWKGYKVEINGHWGWTEIPEDVKQAVFRLVYMRLIGESVDGKLQSGGAVFGDNPIKSVKQPDGVTIVYRDDKTTSGATSLSGTTGDTYADRIVKKYRWRAYGAVI